MKRLIWLTALCLICAITVMPALTACSPDGSSGDGADTSAVAENSIPYSLSEYTVIRPEMATTEIVSASVTLRKQINEILGDYVVAITDDWIKGGVVTDEITQAKEILIGNTTRPESAKALEGVDPTSFVITVIGNKIVINSERTSMVAMAIQYFMDNYLPSASEGVLMLPENFCYVSAPLKQVTFIDKGEQSLNVVYLDSLDNSANAKDENDRLDLDVVYAKDLRVYIQDVAKIKIGLSTDWYKSGTDISQNFEILVGNTTRPETAEFLSTLDYNGYGFAVYGNKIVVTGWNETTTELAVKNFETYFKANLTKHDDGTVSFGMLEGERAVFDYGSWFVDYPEFTDGKIGGVQDAGYGNLQAKFDETTLEAYEAYCKKLIDAGFKLYMENTIADNVHRAYTSKDGLIYVYYVPVEKSVRIISCPDGKYNLPEYTTPESVHAYEKIAESSITQMSLSYAAGNFGLCHIITLEDGSFIVYDGGGNSNNDYIQLYNTLKSLNKRSDGKIVIAAWILTHEHWDHYTNFSTFCKNYSSKIKLEGMYCNTPSGTFAYNGYNPNYYMNSDFANLSGTLGGVKKYIVHTGMKFYIRNACVEIIYTQEDLHPTKLYFFNDSTMVSRVTIAGQTITYLGDVRWEGSDIMSDRYKNELKCDIVQVSHHGYDGGTEEIYRYLNPETCLWPTSAENFANMSSGKTSNNYLKVDTYILKTLKVPVNIYAEPTATINLPFKQGDKITYWDK